MPVQKRHIDALLHAKRMHAMAWTDHHLAIEALPEQQAPQTRRQAGRYMHPHQLPSIEYAIHKDAEPDTWLQAR